ncbi:MAG: pyridoxamine 5'-phosphate oxidase [Saprospiraceae bacterium]
MSNVANLRLEYKLKSLDVKDVVVDPISQFRTWFNEALSSEIREPNAMVIATADFNAIPNARVVLLKGFDEKGFTFYTNYESVKGKELVDNPYAALVFNWMELERQVRIMGTVHKTSFEESTEYFKSRPKSSQIGAWASPQSRVISDRKVIEDNESFLSEEYSNSLELPCPEYWGGFRVVPTHIEFWQGRSSRLHDRIQYRLHDSQWIIERLAP